MKDFVHLTFPKASDKERVRMVNYINLKLFTETGPTQTFVRDRKAEEEAMTIFDHLDVDKSGSVDADELLAFMNKQVRAKAKPGHSATPSARSTTTPRTAFGTRPLRYTRACLREQAVMGGKSTAFSSVSIDDMRKMIQDADENGDNELQRDEFVKFITRV